MPRLPGVGRITAALIAAALVILPPPGAAAAAWQQTEFAIATWLDPPVTGFAQAQPTDIRTYRVAKDAYVSLLSGWPSFFPGPPQGLSHRDMQHARFAAAYAAGLQVMVADTAIATGRTLAGQTCATAVPFTPAKADSVLALYAEPLLTADERAAHGGYFIGDEPPDGSCWPLRQRQWTQAIHDRDPGKPVWINLLPHAFVNLRAQWLDPSAAGPQSVPDVFSIAQYPFVNGTIVLPDGDGNGWPDHDGRRYLENMAVTRQALDSTHVFWHMADVWNLEHDAVTAFDFDDPTPAHLRLYAFAPVAHGATGIVFFGYSHAFLEDRHPDHRDWTYFCATACDTPCTEAAVSRGFLPTGKYECIRAIGHYLHDVVGPVIMSASYRGTWHRDAHPANGDAWYVPATRLAGANSPVVKAIGDDRAMVGVFQGRGADSGTWYLLVVNKDHLLRPISTSITLHPGLGLEVGAAPSVIGYAGGTTYSQVGLDQDVFTVHLQGGEGRLFRLTPAGAGSFLTLLNPAGGETWIAGQRRLVTWDDGGASVSVRLYTDVLGDAPELSGPFVELAPYATGGYALVTVPAVTTHRGRLEIAASDGRRASHSTPIRVRAIANAPSRATWSVAGADGFLQPDLHVIANAPTVLAFGDASRRLTRAKRQGGTWTTSTIADNPCFDAGNTGCESQGAKGSYGYSPSFDFQPTGVGHAAFYTFYNSGTAGSGYDKTWGTTFSVHYGTQATPDFPWHFEKAMVTGSVDGDLALAVNSEGTPHIALNAGFHHSYELRVIRRTELGAWEEWSGPAYTGNPQHLRAAFDPADRLWITFLASNPQRLQVLRQDDVSNRPMLGLSGDYRSPSLAVDAAGGVHLTYARAGVTPGSATLHYRKWSAAGWSAEETVDGSVGTLADAAIALGGTAPRIAYVRNGVATVADRATGSWTRLVLDSGSDADGGVSAKIGGNGTLWASYRDRATNRLMVSSTTGTCANCPVDVGPAPRAHALELRAPNPLRQGDDVRIALDLARPATIRARLYDIAGRVTASLEREAVAGPSEVRWDLSRVRSGVFFVEARLDDTVVVRQKLVIVR